MSQFYAMSVCSPSRISLLTGQKAARHGTITWINPTSDNRGKFGPPDGRRQGLKQGEVTLASVLWEAWYCMIHIGKARLDPISSDGEKPEKLGFEINVGGVSMGQPGSSYGLEDYGHKKSISGRFMRCRILRNFAGPRLISQAEKLKSHGAKYPVDEKGENQRPKLP